MARPRHSMSRPCGALLLLFAMMAALPSFAALNMQLQTGPGGVTIGGSSPLYTADLGQVNGLGAGTADAGVNVLNGASGGVLYTTPYTIALVGFTPGKSITVTAYVSFNFSTPTAVAIYGCAAGGGCGTAAGYSPMSLSNGSPTVLINAFQASNGNNTVGVYLGIYVAELNGASAFQGSQTAAIGLLATESGTGKQSAVSLGVTATGQSAVQLTLGSAPAGVTVSPAADFTIDFGSVNGLGAGNPTSGLTVLAGGPASMYSTPYQLRPHFSNLLSTASTLQVSVSSSFVHSAVLTLWDAALGAGPYSQIPSGSQLTLATGITTGATVTRFLGLEVTKVNGAAAFTGSDTATLTYTLVVP